jgi:glutathione reductase (NADPH)
MNVDLVVVGTGEAAQSVAYPCRDAGWSVAVVDSRPFGGTCELRGCDPKKVLVGVSEVIDLGRRMEGWGVSAPAPALVWPDMIRFKRTLIDSRPAAVEDGFREAGITALHGRAHFVGPASLAVGSETLTGRHVVIAGGARHAPLGIPGEDLVATSTSFLELDQPPARVAFIGGGYIAFEFAHIAARAGASVDIFHRGERPLEAFDADLVGQLVEHTRELGVRVHLGTTVTAVANGAGELVVTARARDGERQATADLVVHAAGRIPEVDDLGLEVAGVARAARAIDLAIGERSEGPVFEAPDGRRLDRHGAARIVYRVAHHAGIAKLGVHRDVARGGPAEAQVRQHAQRGLLRIRRH